MSSGEVGEVGAEGVVDFAGGVAFEAADDVLFGQSLGGAASEVGAGAGAVAQADDDDAVEGGVGGSVAAAVESVFVGAAAAGLGGCDTAEVGEGGLGVQSVRVVAGGGQQLGGGIGADAEQGAGAGSGGAGQGGQFGVC